MTDSPLLYTLPGLRCVALLVRGGGGDGDGGRDALYWHQMATAAIWTSLP